MGQGYKVECSSGPIIRMVFGCLLLLTNSESNVEIIPDYHERTLAYQPSDLKKPFLPECLDFSNSHRVGESEPSMIGNIKLGTGCTASEQINAHCGLKLA